MQTDKEYIYILFKNSIILYGRINNELQQNRHAFLNPTILLSYPVKVSKPNHSVSEGSKSETRKLFIISFIHCFT